MAEQAVNINGTTEPPDVYPWVAALTSIAADVVADLQWISILNDGVADSTDWSCGFTVDVSTLPEDAIITQLTWTINGTAINTSYENSYANLYLDFYDPVLAQWVYDADVLSAAWSQSLNRTMSYVPTWEGMTRAQLAQCIFNIRGKFILTFSEATAEVRANELAIVVTYSLPAPPPDPSSDPGAGLPLLHLCFGGGNII